MHSIVEKALGGYENGVTLDLSRSGKATDNDFLESFDGRLRNDS